MYDPVKFGTRRDAARRGATRLGPAVPADPHPTPNHHAQVSKRAVALQAKLPQTTATATATTTTSAKSFWMTRHTDEDVQKNKANVCFDDYKHERKMRCNGAGCFRSDGYDYEDTRE